MYKKLVKRIIDIVVSLVFIIKIPFCDLDFDEPMT